MDEGSLPLQPKTAMARLRDFPWWPSAWVSETGSSPTTEEISKYGILKNVRRMGNELTLILECNGVIFTATIGAQLSVDLLILLRHILLQQWGESMESVENIDFDISNLR